MSQDSPQTKRHRDPRVKVSTVRLYVDVAEMWRAGISTEIMATSYFTTVNTMGAWVRRARLLLGETLVPHRPLGARPGEKRLPSPLDQLTKPGDVITATKESVGGRNSVHQNARTRGWTVTIHDRGLNWEIIALERVSTLAEVRAEKRKKTASRPPAEDIP